MIVDATVGLPTREVSTTARLAAVHLLRRLIAQPEVLVVPTAHDALSARLVELAGFEAAAMNRRGVTASLLASVDEHVADLEELLMHATAAGTAVSIPLIVDFSPGPHDSIRLRRALSASIKTGFGAFVISDATRRNAVLADDEADVLVHAALDLRADAGDIVLIAKAHVVSDSDTGGVEAAIERAARWARIGADLVQVDSLETRRDHELFASAVPERRVHSASAHLAATDYDGSIATEMGYAVSVWPPVLLEAAAAGMQAALDRINSERDATAGDGTLPQADLDVLLGARSLDELRSRY